MEKRETCAICKRQTYKIFDINGAVTGTPFVVNCCFRCSKTVGAIIDENTDRVESLLDQILLGGDNHGDTKPATKKRV